RHPPSSLDDIRSDSEDGDTLTHHDKSGSDFSVDEAPQPFSQSELTDPVRGLGLSKDGPELLGSRLKNKNLLTSGTAFSWYRHREKEFIQFFSKEENLVSRHSVHLEENYNDLYMILEKINYEEHRWMVCGDFKMLTMLLGQQAGYTKYPCFLCLWDSRARDLHWTKTDW
ncbi:hypothetical protein AVEN_111376-1, partial [Araneus ventricosus]